MDQERKDCKVINLQQWRRDKMLKAILKRGEEDAERLNAAEMRALELGKFQYNAKSTMKICR